MTQDEIIEIAIKCGWDNPANNMMPLYEFAKLVVEKERKRILDVIGDNQCECRCAEVVRGQA